jgi:tetratricopeptide (TPR) repeat protein
MEAAKLDPTDAKLQYELALAYRNLKLYEEALGHFNKALALKPDFSEAWNNMGTLYLVLEKWDPAIGCFEKAAGNITYETPQFAYNNLGLAYYKKGEHQKALDSYKQALELSPSYSICHTNLGLAYEAVGRWEEAIDAYEKAFFYYPENAAAHLNLGKLYLRLGRNDKAAKELNLALDIDPRGPHAEEVRELLQKHL